jgi:hypothetical protein
MSLLSSLFRKKKSNLSDTSLGELESVTSHNDTILWQGRTQFLEKNITFHIPGSLTELHQKEKQLLLQLLQNQPEAKRGIETALREAYDDAGKLFTSIKDHFTCLSIALNNNRAEIIFEEKETFYHFNVEYVNGKITGVASINS